MDFNSIMGISPETEGFKQEKPKIKRTNFNLSEAQFQQHEAGQIQPIDCKEILPNSNIKGKYKISIKFRNPTLRPLKTGFKFYVHSYFVKSKDCWEGFEAFWSHRGEKQLPILHHHITDTGEKAGNPNVILECITPNSIGNCMGLPVLAYTDALEENGKTFTSSNLYSFRPTVVLHKRNNVKSKLNGYYNENAKPNETAKNLETDFGKIKINALPFVAYQKIRRRYNNFNLTCSNKELYPINEKKFILPETWEEFPYCNTMSNKTPFVDTKNYNVITKDLTAGSELTENQKINIPLFSAGSDDYLQQEIFCGGSKIEEEWKPTSITGTKFIHLCGNGFRQRRGDAITTGSPYPNLMRDNVLPFLVTTKNVKDLNDSYYPDPGNPYTNIQINKKEVTDTFGVNVGGVAESARWLKNANETYRNVLNEIGFNIKDLSEMITLTKYKEMLAKINRLDYYNGVIESTFGVNPNIDIGEPIYISGTTANFSTTEEKTTNTEFNATTPNGAIGQGNTTFELNIPDFFTSDHGYLITVISSDIDNVYAEALDKMWTKVTREEMYEPMFNDLEPQATLAREADCSVKNLDDVLNYADRYHELKHGRTKVCGLGALQTQRWDKMQYLTYKKRVDNINYTYFNNNFVSVHPHLIDRSCFYTEHEPMFEIEVAKLLNCTEPLPYKAEPFGEVK